MVEKGELAQGGDTVSLPPNYAPSETYTDSPPPAYAKERKTAVQITRMVCLTIIAAALLIGFFSFATTWLNARAYNVQKDHKNSNNIHAASLIDLGSPLPQVEQNLPEGTETENLINSDLNNNEIQDRVNQDKANKEKVDSNNEEIQPTLLKESEITDLNQVLEVLEDDGVIEELEREVQEEEMIFEKELERQFGNFGKIKLPLNQLLGNPRLGGRNVKCNVEKRNHDMGNIAAQAIIVTCRDDANENIMIENFDADQSKNMFMPLKEDKPMGPPLSIIAPILKMLSGQANFQSQSSFQQPKPKILIQAFPRRMAGPMLNPMLGPMAGPPMLPPMLGPMSGPLMEPMNRPIITSMNRPVITSMNRPMITPMNRPMITPMNRPMIASMNGPMITSMNRPMIGPMSSPLIKFIPQNSNGPLPNIISGMINQPRPNFLQTSAGAPFVDENIIRRIIKGSLPNVIDGQTMDIILKQATKSSRPQIMLPTRPNPHFPGPMPPFMERPVNQFSNLMPQHRMNGPFSNPPFGVPMPQHIMDGPNHHHQHHHDEEMHHHHPNMPEPHTHENGHRPHFHPNNDLKTIFLNEINHPRNNRIEIPVINENKPQPIAGSPNSFPFPLPENVIPLQPPPSKMEKQISRALRLLPFNIRPLRLMSSRRARLLSPDAPYPPVLKNKERKESKLNSLFPLPQGMLPLARGALPPMLEETMPHPVPAASGRALPAPVALPSLRFLPGRLFRLPLSPLPQSLPGLPEGRIITHMEMKQQPEEFEVLQDLEPNLQPPAIINNPIIEPFRLIDSSFGPPKVHSVIEDSMAQPDNHHITIEANFTPLRPEIPDQNLNSHQVDSMLSEIQFNPSQPAVTFDPPPPPPHIAREGKSGIIPEINPDAEVIRTNQPSAQEEFQTNRKQHLLVIN